MDKNTAKQEPIINKLFNIQQEIKAPKNEDGRFGKHRSAEGIIKALKPLLKKYDCVLTLSDDIVQIGERNYIKVTAILQSGKDAYFTTAFAWEGNVDRGLDASQITGSASSYARKYAMSGLFALDNTDMKDADSIMDQPTSARTAKPAPKPAADPLISRAQIATLFASMRGKGFEDKDQVTRILHNFAGVKSITEVKKSDASKLISDLKDLDKTKLLEFDIENVKDSHEG